MNYSQNNEQEIILNYFKDHPAGWLLDIGANDGVTFSNSLALIERGWNADLIEPNPEAYGKLCQLHSGNSNVSPINIAISSITGAIQLYINTPHIPNDTGLLSTTVADEKQKWDGVVQYTTVIADSMTWDEYRDNYGEHYDFVTIDAEGMDLTIFTAMNLTEMGTKLVCVEHNGKDVEKFIQHGEKHGMKVIAMNRENLIIGI